MKIRKAVVPGGGYGTRMLPLVDKPVIQIIVEELVEAGITDIIITTAAHKTDLAEYFGEADPGLVSHLRASGADKAALAEDLENVRHLANFAFVEQTGVYGTGTPVLCAEPYLGNEPFLYTFADDFFIAQGENSFSQLIRVYEQYGVPVVGGQLRTSPGDDSRYGFVGGDDLGDGVTDIRTIVEQPGKYGLESPGPLASIGGFVVTPEVLGYLKRVRHDLPAGKELFFNAALGLMVAEGKRVLAREITDARYYDTGNKLEYMKTAVAMAARHPEIGDEFRRYLIDFTAKEIQS